MASAARSHSSWQRPEERCSSTAATESGPSISSVKSASTATAKRYSTRPILPPCSKCANWRQPCAGIMSASMCWSTMPGSAPARAARSAGSAPMAMSCASPSIISPVSCSRGCCCRSSSQPRPRAPSTSAVTAGGQSPLDFGDVRLTRGYDGGRAYTQSKLAQVMFTCDLARELEGTGVTVNCLHPATYMDTTMVRESGVSPISTVKEGADAILNLALSDDLAGRTGLYFDRQRVSRANAQAYDETARRKLRVLSLELAGLS